MRGRATGDALKWVARLGDLVEPGADVLTERAAKRLAGDARVLLLGAPPGALAGRDVVAPPEDALAFLRACDEANFPVIVIAWPSRQAPLMPLLMAARDALPADGELIVCDLVWQTAPTLDLLKAFAPASGREKVRPIEGWEMQAEHAGFQVVEREAIDRARWVDALPEDARSAVEADTRGAASLVLWALRPAAEE